MRDFPHDTFPVNHVDRSRPAIAGGPIFGQAGDGAPLRVDEQAVPFGVGLVYADRRDIGQRLVAVLAFAQRRDRRFAFADQPLLQETTRQGLEQVVRSDRLSQIIVGPDTDRVDRVFGVGETGHRHADQVGDLAPENRHQVEAVMDTQLDVENGGVGPELSGQSLRGLGGCRAGHDIASRLKQIGQRFEQVHIIIDQQDSARRRATTAARRRLGRIGRLGGFRAMRRVATSRAATRLAAAARVERY